MQAANAAVADSFAIGNTPAKLALPSRTAAINTGSPEKTVQPPKAANSGPAPGARKPPAPPPPPPLPTKAFAGRNCGLHASLDRL